jgi:hypothetical protein
MLQCNLSDRFFVARSKETPYRIVTKHTSFERFERASDRYDRLKEIDDTLVIPKFCCVRDNGELCYVEAYPVFGDVNESLDGIVITPRRAPLCDEVVRSALLRWLHGFGARFHHYFLDSDGNVVSTRCQYARSYPLGGLTADQKEQFREIALALWDEIMKPLLIQARKQPSSRLRELVRLLSPTLDCVEQSLTIEDLELLDKYPTYDSKTVTLSLEQSCGVFVSSFVRSPSPQEVYNIMMRYVSFQDIQRLLPPLRVLLQDLECKSKKELSVIALKIYDLFSRCECNAEIFFYSLLGEKQSSFPIEYPDIKDSELRTALSHREPFSVPVFAIPETDFEGWEPSNHGYWTYEGLVWGPPLENYGPVAFEGSACYCDHSFYPYFETVMRCARPLDIVRGHDTLYSMAMERMMYRNYAGFL